MDRANIVGLQQNCKLGIPLIWWRLVLFESLLASAVLYLVNVVVLSVELGAERETRYRLHSIGIAAKQEKAQHTDFNEDTTNESASVACSNIRL